MVMMATELQTSSRKRPMTAGESGGKTPTKRRRLELEAASSPSTPTAIKAIEAAISNVFRLGGRRSETGEDISSFNRGDDGPEPDDQSQATQRPRSSLKANGSARKVAFEISESGDELSTTEALTPSAVERRTPRAGAQGSRKSKGARTRPDQSPLTVRKDINKGAPHLLDDKAGCLTRSKTTRTPSSATRKLKEALGRGSQSSVKGGTSHLPPANGEIDLAPWKGRKDVLHAGSGSSKDVLRHRTELIQASEGSADEPPTTAETGDEEVCQICSEPDSHLGNEILLCDGCDQAFHQECCAVPEVPEGDWFCKNCIQQPEAAPSGVGEGETDVVRVNGEVSRIPNFEQHLRDMQRVLVARCTGRRRIRLRGHDEAQSKVHQLVEQTVLAGEGNSMLIIGARGAGKTTLVEGVLSDLATEHREAFHVVRLNGFIHTDDKLALKEIWRQLGKEMEVEDDLVQKTNNYADTLQSLLAVLSHPSELGASVEEGVTSKAVVFVIDEFDLFATHARQTLLYNLFDIAQARKAPIAVLGLTTRIDVVESLEKRVKSRFSHRYVHLALVKSLPAYWDICRQGLVVDEMDMAAEGLDCNRQGHGQFWTYWNKYIEALYADEEFKQHLESYFYSSKSVPAFLVSCILPLSSLSPASARLVFSTPPSACSLGPPDSKLHLLSSLSDLELSLLISAARLDITAHTDTVNFAMAYDEYVSLMGRQRLHSASAGMLALGGGSKVWGRGVAGMAWERLAGLGLLLPAAFGARTAAGGGGGGALAGGQAGGSESKMWKLEVALEEIPGAVKLASVMAKWCREI